MKQFLLTRTIRDAHSSHLLQDCHVVMDIINHQSMIKTIKFAQLVCNEITQSVDHHFGFQVFEKHLILAMYEDCYWHLRLDGYMAINFLA